VELSYLTDREIPHQGGKRMPARATPYDFREHPKREPAR
jgi:hypothetical protein